ncbi:MULTISPECIES: hypothetical protein [Comamonas]|uniref:hypothetical protein n=1 Tax=Comamonas TaxID=283 RepID=UPI00257F7731|nr:MULTISPECIES: hypothetical protein [Comamonas]
MTTSTPKTELQKPATTPANQPSHRFTSVRHQPVFCEGVSQVSLGYPVSRLVFSSHPPQRSADGNEISHFVATEIVLPTIGLAELAKQIIESLVQGKDQLEAGGAGWNKELIDLITELQTAQINKA